MTRTLWIAALSSALACFIGGTVFYATARFAHGAMTAVGCFVLASCLLLLWVGVRYLRFSIGEALHGPYTGSVSRAASADSELLRG